MKNLLDQFPQVIRGNFNNGEITILVPVSGISIDSPAHYHRVLRLVKFWKISRDDFLAVPGIFVSQFYRCSVRSRSPARSDQSPLEIFMIPGGERTPAIGDTFPHNFHRVPPTIMRYHINEPVL